LTSQNTASESKCTLSVRKLAIHSSCSVRCKSDSVPASSLDARSLDRSPNSERKGDGMALDDEAEAEAGAGAEEDEGIELEEEEDEVAAVRSVDLVFDAAAATADDEEDDATAGGDEKMTDDRAMGFASGR
jgi:hypothetical protein